MIPPGRAANDRSQANIAPINARTRTDDRIINGPRLVVYPRSARGAKTPPEPTFLEEPCRFMILRIYPKHTQKTAPTRKSSPATTRTPFLRGSKHGRHWTPRLTAPNMSAEDIPSSDAP